MTADRNEILMTLSDLHKDVRGFRPSGEWMRAAREMADADLSKMYDYLCEESARSMAAEAAAEAQAVLVWEVRINLLVETGARDRATAIRWDMDAQGATMNGQPDVGYYEYLCGIPYGHAKQFV